MRETYHMFFSCFPLFIQMFTFGMNTDPLFCMHFPYLTNTRRSRLPVMYQLLTGRETGCRDRRHLFVSMSTLTSPASVSPWVHSLKPGPKLTTSNLSCVHKLFTPPLNDCSRVHAVYSSSDSLESFYITRLK